MKTRLFIVAATLSLGAFHCSYAEDAKTDPANQALKDDVLRLKEENQLKQDLNESRKQLIESQKGVIDMQKQLAASQKDLLDAMFPKIEGGKTGSLSLVADANITPLVQAQAASSLKGIAKEICADVASKSKKFVIGSDSDLQLAATYRLAILQLAGLQQAYEGQTSTAIKAVAPNAAGAPGLYLYGAGALAKQLSSFLQLFWEDKTLYIGAVSVDDRALHDALAECVVETSGQSARTAFSGVAAAITTPTNSSLLSTLSDLSYRRHLAQARIAAIKASADPKKSGAEQAALESLNTQYDTLVTALFSPSEKENPPPIFSLLVGESVANSFSSQYVFLSARITYSSGLGLKSTSLWHPDRMHAASSIGATYHAVDLSGNILAAGSRNTEIKFDRVNLN